MTADDFSVQGAVRDSVLLQVSSAREVGTGTAPEHGLVSRKARAVSACGHDL